MLHHKLAATLTVIAVVALGFIGQAVSQESRPANRRGGSNRTPEEMQARMEQFRQEAETKMKESLGVTDEEWKALQPKVEAVRTMERQTRGGGFGRMMGGPGGRGGPGAPGGPGAGRPADNARPQSDVETKMASLQKILDNKGATPGEIASALTAVREARTKAKADLEKAQKDLKEFVTARQEAVLVSMGILD